MMVCRFHSLAATVPLVQPLSLQPTINADAGLIARCNAYLEAHYHALYGISQSYLLLKRCNRPLHVQPAGLTRI